MNLAQTFLDFSLRRYCRAVLQTESMEQATSSKMQTNRSHHKFEAACGKGVTVNPGFKLSPLMSVH